uniref:Uncharacterized protein n=1 Tax=Plectus sambesii TaxID=2011161 RepID=A0A914VPL1_9BILA
MNDLMDLGEEVDHLKDEYVWLQRDQGESALKQIESLMRECCRKLPISSKLRPGLSFPSSAVAQQPEKFVLASRNSDSVRCTVTMLGENVVNTDVAIRYPKAPGGTFRSVAQPDIQWKLQQLQDAANFCARAIETTLLTLQRVRALRTAGQDGTPAAGRQLARAANHLVSQLQAARAALMMPKKRSLLELQEFRPNKCFNPSLPSDLLLSYYVSSSKIVCAAYHLQATQPAPGRQAFSVYQGECHVPYLADVLQTLNSALQIAEQLKTKLAVFHDCKEMKTFLAGSGKTIAIK